MRSKSMSNALHRLVLVWGESYGRTKWVDLLQKYGVMPWDEVPERMLNELGRVGR